MSIAGFGFDGPFTRRDRSTTLDPGAVGTRHRRFRLDEARPRLGAPAIVPDKVSALMAQAIITAALLARAAARPAGRALSMLDAIVAFCGSPTWAARDRSAPTFRNRRRRVSSIQLYDTASGHIKWR
ncbi:MAG: hypothetical protein IPM80_17990 [Proteobacteria bacterium]|nr:hypothetical protein [Pseudomonadota bacterium]